MFWHSFFQTRDVSMFALHNETACNPQKKKKKKGNEPLKEITVWESKWSLPLSEKETQVYNRKKKNHDKNNFKQNLQMI